MARPQRTAARKAREEMLSQIMVQRLSDKDGVLVKRERDPNDIIWIEVPANTTRRRI